MLPRDNKKTTLAAKIALHHLVTEPRADVIIGAASVNQARIAYERMRGFAEHPALTDELVIRHLEPRHEDDEGRRRFLRVVPSDGARAHGLSSSLYIVDELWAHRDEGLYEARLTGLIKHPGAKLIAISAAAAQLDSPLGRLRARALAQPTTTRTGPLVESTGDVPGSNGRSPKTATRPPLGRHLLDPRMRLRHVEGRPTRRRARARRASPSPRSR